MADHNMGWKTTSTDMKYILQLTGLILRRGGLALRPSGNPMNVYTKELKALSPSMLDVNYKSIGEYIITKYLVKERLCGLTESDYRNIECYWTTRTFKTGQTKHRGHTKESMCKNLKCPKFERCQ